MRLLVDTDVLIEFLRGHPDTVSAMTQLDAAGCRFHDSPVVRAELEAGMRPSEHAAVTRLFRLFRCLPLSEAEGHMAGELLRKFRSSHGLELGDALIAALALCHRLPLWTLNRKHFQPLGVELFEA